MSGARSRPQELTFWPSSVISRTPAAASCVTSATMSPGRRLCSRPRTDGHDAVRARRVAAHRHLHPRVGRPLAVLRQVAGEVLVRAEPAAVDAGAARADPLAEVRDRARPERHVDLRIEVEDPLLLRLGEAAADGDHEVGILALPGAGVAEIGGELGVRLLADRARVEDDEIGVLLRDGLPHAERLEHALDALGVVAVHLTAERGQVVAAHGGSVGARPAARGSTVERTCRRCAETERVRCSSRRHATVTGGKRPAARRSCWETADRGRTIASRERRDRRSGSRS